ncbi:MAG: Rpn family recombination-promoting nuclease/putative transposase [Saprospiraceae bacterium]|nr:Rpn family recombination-promoting nuclease/putative transposase [Saprospiraceae bacterium]
MVTKEKYINPFTDFGFKKLFGTEPNKDLLIDFLNQVILPKRRQITDLTYKKTEHLGATEFDRKAIFDLYCIGSNNERFIVEMQKAKQNYFKDRTVFYASFPIQEQAQQGDWNYKLSEIFTVGVLDFVFSDEPNPDVEKDLLEDKGRDKRVTKRTTPQEESDVRHVVQLKDENCRVFYDKLTFIYLEMPNFTKTVEQLETTYDKWLYVLENLPNLQKRPHQLQETIFDRLFETAEIAKFSSQEKEQYEDSLKTYRDLKNVIDTAFDEGESKGKIEGEIEEKTRGISKALKRGKLTIEEIAEDFDTTVNFVLDIKERYNL